MSDIRNLSGISFDAGVSAPVSEVPDAGEVFEEDQVAFHHAIEKSAELDESRSPETRKAIKRSLDRFQASPNTEGASGSSESDVTDANRDRSTRLTSGRPAGAATKDGPVAAMRSRRAADAGGEYPATARGRYRSTAPISPPFGDGGSRGATASSWASAAKQREAIAGRKPAGTAAQGVLAPRQARAEPAIEATVARTTPTTGAQAAPPRVPSASSGSLKESNVSGSGAAVARTTPTTGAQATPPRMHGASSASLKEGKEDITSGPGAGDAHDPDIAATDMTGVAASAGIVESEQTHTPEGVLAPVSRAAELADQVADRILVSMPDSSTPGEVRISLKQSILDGSEVRIFHEGGELKVVFVAETESAQRLLFNNKERLQQTLEERLQDQKVQIDVEAPGRDGASREDRHGRSRQQYVRQDVSGQKRPLF